MTSRDRYELEQIRSAYKSLLKLHNDIFKFIEENAKADASEIMKYERAERRDMVRHIRHLVRQYVKYHPDPLEESLRSGTQRVIWEHDKDETPDLSDGPTYYWIDPDINMSDDEIEEIRQCESYRCTSPYDCCGQKFTWSFHARRTPVGIAFINRTSFDY